MGNKIVILVPVFTLFLVISFGVNQTLLHYDLLNWPIDLKEYIYKRSIPRRVKHRLPFTTPEELLTKINQYRQNQDLEHFQQDETTCATSTAISDQGADASNDQVFNVCATCTHAALVKISKFANSSQIVDFLLSEEGSAKLLNDDQLTHLCISEDTEYFTLFFAKHDPQTRNQSPETKPPITIDQPSANTTNFSEDQLWQALVDYRHAHTLPDLIREEQVCQYARKRVQDHITMLAEKEPSEYPVPDKYPLDAHAGFSRDADNSYAFDVTGKNQLAENLAYWPTAEYASHIIEWGWDTSTEGHRETQLSTDYTHACLSGQDGFYVAIFGK